MSKNIGSKVLSEMEVKNKLELLGVNTTTCTEANSVEEAKFLAESVGYPVVMKVNSSIITHKSDVGGVIVNLKTPEDVEKAYNSIKSRVEKIDPNANVTIQKMASPGLEVIIGMTTSPDFGKVAMFGLGGVFTEVLKDIAFTLIPVKRQAALDMFSSLQGRKLMEGYRGSAPVDKDAIISILEAISKLCAQNPNITELDLNPVIVYEHGAVVVDGRAVVTE